MSKTIRVSLPEEGADKYLEIRNPLFLRVKEQRQLQKADDETDAQYSDRFLQSTIVNGNVTAEDGRYLQYPMTPDDIAELTGYTINAIMDAFKQASEAVAPKN